MKQSQSLARFPQGPFNQPGTASGYIRSRLLDGAFELQRLLVVD